MSPHLKRLFQFLKLALGLALLLALVFLVDWGGTWRYLRDAQLSWLIPGLLISLTLLGVKSLRSGVLLQQLGVDLTAGQVFAAYMAGQALNILLPVRGGELVRFSMLGAGNPERAAESASTLVAEKVLDASALAVLVGLLLVVLPADRAGETVAALLPGVGVLILIVALTLVAAFAFWPWLYTRLEPLFGGKIQGLLRKVDEALRRWRALLRGPRALLPVAGLTLANWLLMGLMNWVHFRAAGIDLGALAAAVVLALLMVGLLPALSPGNIGPFHFFAALGLRPFGVPVEQGVAFAILLHAVVTLPTLVIGGLVLLLPGRRVSPEVPLER